MAALLKCHWYELHDRGFMVFGTAGIQFVIFHHSIIRWPYIFRPESCKLDNEVGYSEVLKMLPSMDVTELGLQD